MSKPSIPLQITIERDPEVKTSNYKSAWYDKVNRLQRQENVTDDEAQKRERTASFFAKNTFKRCATNPSYIMRKMSKEEKGTSTVSQDTHTVANGTLVNSTRERAYSLPKM